ncbi:MAG TPA: transcriptional activator RfaH [Nitrospinaceae bacterium]|nr:transcriptional activator RfaH [Nitrospinaceae bacterium]
MHWYVVNTKPRQENFAVSNLIRLGVETYSPQIKRSKIVRRRRTTIISPLFPRYIFACFDLSSQHRSVKYAHGVIDIVVFGMEPAIIDEAMIESIKARSVEGFVRIQSPLWEKGQRVRIEEGPFQGMEAVFEHMMSDQQRVAIMLQALSYHPRIVIDREQIKAVSSS